MSAEAQSPAGLPIAVWRHMARHFQAHPPARPPARPHPLVARIRRRPGIPPDQPIGGPADPAHPLVKPCSTCGVEKHTMEFYLDRRDGRRVGQCKTCRRAVMRRYQRANRERISQRNHRHYAAHRDEMRDRQRANRAARREEANATQRAWRRRNPEKERAAQRRYRARHPRKAAVRQATYLMRRLGIIPSLHRCEDCGGAAVEHHHLHYHRPDSPFAVVALCRPCHVARHHGRRRPHAEHAEERRAEGGEKRAARKGEKTQRQSGG
jgi:hypothetical protein